MLAKVALIDGKRKTNQAGENQIFDPVQRRLQRLEACQPFGQVAHRGRPPELEKHQTDRRAIQEVPQQQPVSALEVSVRPGLRVRRDLRKISVGSSLDIES